MGALDFLRPRTVALEKALKHNRAEVQRLTTTIDEIRKDTSAIGGVVGMARYMTMKADAKGDAPTSFNPYAAWRYYQDAWMLAVCVNKRANELVKHGWEFVPKFQHRCMKCSADYTEQPDVCACGSRKFREPDRKQLELVNTLFEHPNPRQGLSDIIKQLARDHDILDDWYLEVVPAIDDEHLAELWPLDGRGMSIRTEGRRLGRHEYFCIVCYPLGTNTDIYRGKEYGAKKCRTCGEPLVEVAYEQQGENGKIARWPVDRIIHGNSYGHGVNIMGESPIIPIRVLLDIMIAIETFQSATYLKTKSPDSIMIISGISQPKLNKQLEEIAIEKKKHPELREDLCLALDNTQSKLERVRLIDSMVDQDAIKFLMFARESLAAYWGVPLAALGVETPGRLGEATAHIEVMPDAILELQAHFESYFNRMIATHFKEVTDWVWELVDPSKRNEMAAAQLGLVEAQRAQTLANAGFEVRFSDGVLLIEGSGSRMPTPALSSYVPEPSSKSLQKADDASRVQDALLRTIYAAYDEAVDNIIAEGGKLDRDALEALAERVIGEARAKMIRIADPHIRRAYEIGLQRAASDLRVKMTFSQIDVEAIDALKTKPEGFFHSIKTFGAREVAVFRDIIQRHFEMPGGVQVQAMAREMREATGGAKFNIDRIARTEVTKIVNTAQYNGYKREGDPDADIDWVGPPDDDRTSATCKAIKYGGIADVWGTPIECRGNPYKLAELHDIIGDGAPHANCRHGMHLRPRGYTPVGLGGR